MELYDGTCGTCIFRSVSVMWTLSCELMRSDNIFCLCDKCHVPEERLAAMKAQVGPELMIVDVQYFGRSPE